MIIKNYEIDKIVLKNNPFILIYGKNEGFKNQTTKNLIRDKNYTSYDEKEILENTQDFLENLYSKSLFENEKIIIIKRVTDKIYQIFNEILNKNLEDITLIFNSENLEKKSKLRSFFEKDTRCICIAFYPDNEQTLLKIASNYFRQKKISISQSNINKIVNKVNGDRENLFNEILKLENFIKNGKKLTDQDIIKLTNLSENISISELVDNCLAKNKNKIANILNENNFTNEDCIIISRILLAKSKKILKLVLEYEMNKNLDLAISNAKPPIFWKDKEITKKQINEWNSKNLKKLIYKLNEIELVVKKNLNNSINIISDFILEQSVNKTNN